MATTTARDYQLITYSEACTSRFEEMYASEAELLQWFQSSVSTWRELGAPDLLFWVRAMVNGRIVASFANVPERHAVEQYINS